MEILRCLVVLLATLSTVLVSGCKSTADDDSTTTVTPDRPAAVSTEGVTIKVPQRAVAAEGRLRVKSGQPAPSDAVGLTGMSMATATAEVGLEGTELTGRATIEWAVPEDWDASIVPVVVWQDGSGGWRWLPTTVSGGPGQRTATAQTPHFSSGFLGGFDPEEAASKAAEAIKNFFTGRAGVDQPRCAKESDLRRDFTVTSTQGDAVKWCAGIQNGKPVLKVANNRRTFAQLSLPLGSKVIAGDDWGFSVNNLVRAVGTGVATFAAAFPKDRTILLLDAGKTVTIQLPKDKVGGASIVGSGFGFLLQILVNAADMYSIVAGGAGAKATADGHAVLGLLSDGAGKRSDWAKATTECLRKYTDTYTDNPSKALTLPEEIGRAGSFAGGCGAEIGKASIEDSGPLGWLVSSVAATVASVVSLVYSLVEQLIVGIREVVDAIAYGFGSKKNPTYDIVIQPKGTETILVNPVSATGKLNAGYNLNRSLATVPVDCTYDEGSPVAVTGGTHSCGGVADNTFACWNAPTRRNAVWCLFNPWEHRVVERSAQALKRTSPPDDPKPFGIETTDGSRWFFRVGGAWDMTPTGTLPIYGCRGGPCSGQAGNPVLVADDSGGDWIDTSDRWWTVLVAESGSDADALPAPKRLRIRTVWFITNDQN